VKAQDLSKTYQLKSSLLESELVRVDSRLFNSGKKLRYQLVGLMAEFFGLEKSDVFEYAKVAELVHNATLCHDDVIDNATKRRGVNSINVQVGNKKAVLTGDYLLSQAMYELAVLGNSHIVADMAQTLTLLVEGEWLQFELKSENLDYSQHYKEVSNKKTGSLFRWCCLVPLRIKGLNEFENEVTKFSYNLGEAYQIVDDILDFKEGSEKTPLIDVNNENINYVLIEALKHEDFKQKFYEDSFSAVKKSKKVMNQSMKEARQKAAKLLFDAESNLKSDFC
jgi:geranylgeranyl pyrophosphate synthase